MSIVVAAKGSRRLLEGLIEAVLAMPLVDTDLVVIDSGSTDGTAALLESFAPGGQSAAISWLSQPDSGIAEAWNRGVARARGDWVVFLGADDRVVDAASWNAAVDAIQDVPATYSVAAFPVVIVSPSGAILAVERPAGDAVGQVRISTMIPHQGVFHRRSLWADYGPFDTSFAIAADYEYLLRLQSAGVAIKACGGRPPVAMTFGGASKQSVLANRGEFRRAQRQYGISVPRLRRCRDWCAAWLRCGVAACCGEAKARRWADLFRRLCGLPPVWHVS